MRIAWVMLLLGCAASSVRTPIADVPSNHRSFEITGYTTTAFQACEGTATFGAPQPAVTEDHDACMQRRGAVLARMQETTDASARAELAKTVPECAKPPPADAIQLECDGRMSLVAKSDVASLDLAKPSRSGQITLGVVATVVVFVLIAVWAAHSIRIGH